MGKAILKLVVVLAVLAFHGHAQTPLDPATSLRLRYRVLDNNRRASRLKSLSSAALRDEIERAVQQFPEIQKDEETFQAITQHLGFQPTSTFGADEKLLVYRDYVELQAIHLEPLGDKFRVTVEGATDLPSCAERTTPCHDVFIVSQGQIEGGMAVGLATGGYSSPPLRDLTRQTGSSEDFPAVRIEKLIAPELRYGIEEHFGRLFFCDPDCIPNCRFDASLHLRAFPEIQKDSDTFLAITKHLRLEKVTEFSDTQKLAVYGEYKKLAAIELEPLAEKYKFRVRVLNDSAKWFPNGFSIEGLIDHQKTITILKKEPTWLSCPVCLPGSTGIDAPGGSIALKDLQKGMLVWTLDANGQRVAEPVLKTTAVSVPFDHPLVHLVLKDGRELWASPNHPTVDGRTVRQLERNDAYDHTTVAYVEVVRSSDSKTYDLLPAGDTGFYWANGILIASTLR